MKYPGIYTLKALQIHDDNVQAGINGEWVPARPMGYPSLAHRIKCAWMVFTGRADAVIWPEGQ